MSVVVSTDWVADHLDDDDVRVVDVRDAWEYGSIGHVPGAVNIPFDRFRSGEEGGSAGENGSDSDTADGGGQGGSTAENGTGTAGMLPEPEVWRELLEEAGVGPDDTLVAYDDTHGVFAARFLVTAELYGHADRRLLDGDYSAWTREHRTSTETPDVERTTYEVTRPEATPLVDYETVLEAVERVRSGGDDVVILDTREAWEYDEGHLPGATQLDWRELVDEDTRGLRPRGELEQILTDHGVTPDRRVLLYCNTARRISHTYLVLRHLGYEDVAFYEGSMTEWEARGGPVETGRGETGRGETGRGETERDETAE